MLQYRTDVYKGFDLDRKNVYAAILGISLVIVFIGYSTLWDPSTNNSNQQDIQVDNKGGRFSFLSDRVTLDVSPGSVTGNVNLNIQEVLNPVENIDLEVLTVLS